MPSVTKIAQYAGVSKSTVSLVINNKPGVSDNKRKQILTAINELKAQERTVTTERGRKVTHLSMVILHPAIVHSNQVHAEFLRGIQAGADLHQVQLRFTTNDPNSSQDHISHLYITDPDLRPDGLLIMGARLHEPLAEEARKQNIPYILISRQAPDSINSAVGWDESEAAQKATNHLLDLGHRHIGFVGGDEIYSYTHGRLLGYRTALRNRGIEPQPEWVSLGKGKEATQAFVRKAPQVSALLFVNDSHAVAGLPILQAAGFTLPQDLSIVSFDDTAVASSFAPALTSVYFPRYEVGLWAVKVLVDKIRNPLMESAQIIFKCSLTKRRSCTKPSQLFSL